MLSFKEAEEGYSNFLQRHIKSMIKKLSRLQHTTRDNWYRGLLIEQIHEFNEDLKEVDNG